MVSRLRRVLRTLALMLPKVFQHSLSMRMRQASSRSPTSTDSAGPAGRVESSNVRLRPLSVRENGRA
jgi:hypothetical protein